MLRDGLTLAEVTDRITSRWSVGVHLIPATNDEV
jgi:LPPG:FO 2-phospho-L-lactate transferase